MRRLSHQRHGSDVSPPHGSETKGRRSARHEASRRHGRLPRSADIRWLAAWRFPRLKPIPVAGSSRLLSVTRCSDASSVKGTNGCTVAVRYSVRTQPVRLYGTLRGVYLRHPYVRTTGRTLFSENLIR